MRYIGNKEKLLPFIIDTITDSIGSIEGKIVADLFCGTTSVSRALKKHSCHLITNDYMNFSYALQMAYIHNNTLPSFDKLSSKFGFNGYNSILNYLNELSNYQGFFYSEYCPEGSKDKEYQRNYFSSENAISIDSIRNQIGNWYNSGLISEDEFYFLLTSLIDSVTKVSNISGTYGAFLKIDDKRKHDKLSLEPIEVISSNLAHQCNCKDIMEIITEITGDILYLDPPYNTRLYPPYYHILDTVALYDNPPIYGKTGRRPYTDKLSPFCYKNKTLEAFDFVIKHARFSHIFISYSTEGLVTENDLYNILKQYGKVEIFHSYHKRFKSNSYGQTESNTKSALKELILYVRKHQQT